MMSDGTFALRQTVRDLVAEWAGADRFTPRADAWLSSFDLEFSRELARHRLLGINWPTEYGGGGGSNVDRLAVTEELLRAGAPVAAHWIGDRQIGPAIVNYGNERLKAEMLPGLASATHIFCLGMSEPGAGSDLAAVRTKAVRVAGGWSISGHKIWTSHAHRATHAYVLARTSDGARKHDGLSEFIIDMADPGVQVDPIIDLAGRHHFNEVRLSDVLVPEHRLLGVEGQGWRQVTRQLSFERGGPERVLSSYPLLRALVAAPCDDSAYAELIGTLVARLAALRRLCYTIATSLDRGEAPIEQAAALKYLGNMFERDVVEAGRRLNRGGVEPVDSPYAENLLASASFDIRGGASDVLLSIIGKREAQA